MTIYNNSALNDRYIFITTQLGRQWKQRLPDLPVRAKIRQFVLYAQPTVYKPYRVVARDNNETAGCGYVLTAEHKKVNVIHQLLLDDRKPVFAWFWKVMLARKLLTPRKVFG